MIQMIHETNIRTLLRTFLSTVGTLRMTQSRTLRRTQTVAAAIAVVALVLLASLFPSSASAKPAPPAPASFFGIVPQTGITENDLKLMRSARVGAVRIPVNWPEIEPTPGIYRWEALDSLIQSLSSLGVFIMPVVYGSPPWIDLDYKDMPVDNAAERRAWARFCGDLVRRYGPGSHFWRSRPDLTPRPLRVWQIWNEANDHYFSHAKVGDYAQLLNVSYPAIKTVAPKAKVILSGLYSTPVARPPKAMPATSFLRRLYKRPGIKRVIDGVAVHPYADTPEKMMRKIQKLRAVMIAHGQRNTDLWVTEFGWGSQARGKTKTPIEFSFRGQARALRRSYELLLSKRREWRLQGAYWFTWKDIPESIAPCTFCDSVGLVRANGTPKPALAAFDRLPRLR